MVYIFIHRLNLHLNVIWIRNEAHGHGGGVYILGSKSRAYCSNCEFHNNTSIRGGGAVYLKFYPATPSPFGECGTSMTFTSTTLFSMNHAKKLLAMQFTSISKIPTTSLYSVHFASLCFHRKSMIYINNNNNNNIIATSPYKLAIGKPGLLTPSVISPGVQLKGRLQVQDVFGRSCTEIKDGEYSAAIKLKHDHQITFQGSTVFLIRESGVADLSYLNELKIVGAPSNLIGKNGLTFS